MNEKNKHFINSADFFSKDRYITDEIVIYGIGKYGKMLIDYLIDIGKKDIIKGIVVTSKNDSEDIYKGIFVQDADVFFKSERCRNYCVIVSVSMKYQSDILTTLKKLKIGKYYFLTRNAYIDLKKRTDKRRQIPFQKLDFLIAGFMKCGTTSLYNVLSGLDSIFLPSGKETHFFYWANKVPNPKKELINRYFSDIREGQKVGSIEPSFYSNAEDIYQYFGSDMKIVFILRNPVDATFSLYKMLNRDGGDFFEGLYQKYGIYDNNMFLDYFKSVVQETTYQFHYAYWLGKFIKYFSERQILVVLFEELIKFPEEKLNQILSFIGVQENYTCVKFPQANEGDFVMKDLKGYEIARHRAALMNEMYLYSGQKAENMLGGGQLQSEIIQIQSEYEKANKINGLKLGSHEKEILEQYFYKEVRNLEEMINKKLTDVWF